MTNEIGFALVPSGQSWQSTRNSQKVTFSRVCEFQGRSIYGYGRGVQTLVGAATSRASTSNTTSMAPKAAEKVVKSSERSRSSKSQPIIVKRTGMNSAMVLSKELQEFLGEAMMTRSEIASKLCQYVKEHDLYVKGNKQRFVCDGTLKKILQTDGEHLLFHLHKLIGPHLTHPSSLGLEYEEKARKLFQQYLKRRGAIDSSELSGRKDPRGRNSEKAQKELRAKGLGMYADVEIAPCLRPICEGKEKMSRPQVLKSVWNYIKSNELQDAENGRRIIVNDELRDALQITDKNYVDCFHLSRYVCRLCKPKSDVSKA